MRASVPTVLNEVKQQQYSLEDLMRSESVPALPWKTERTPSPLVEP